MPNGNLYQLGVKFNIQNSSMEDRDSSQRSNSFQFGNGGYISRYNTPSPHLSPRSDPFERQQNPDTAVIIEELRQLRVEFAGLRKSVTDLPGLIAEAMLDILKPK